MKNADNPKWLTVTTSFLIGWNVFGIITAFLFLVTIITYQRILKITLLPPWIAYALLTITFLLALGLGVKSGRKSYPWLKKQKLGIVIAIAVFMVLISIASIPQPFIYDIY